MRLGPQTNGRVTWRDLTALPCAHPHCCSVGYMLKTDSGSWRSPVAIVGHDRLKQHLELVSNRTADHEIPAQLRELVKQSFLGLLSEQSSLTHPAISELFRNICENCDLGLATLLRLARDALLGARARMRPYFAERTARTTYTPFCDHGSMLD